MSAVVHATCPGCKQVLRIPADWLGQAFKCKHCGMVIQARGKTPPTAKPVAVPVTAKRPAAPAPVAKRSSGGDPFSFDGDAEDTSPRRRSRRRSGRSGLVTGMIIVASVIVLAGAGTYFAWPYLSDLKSKSEKELADKDDSGRKEERASHNPRDTELDLPVGPTKTTKKIDLPRTEPTTKKADPPKNTETTKSEKPDKPPKIDLPVKAGPLPRRALAISINNYLFANPINYGMPLRSAANVQSILERMTHNSSLHIPADQVALLSDMAPDRVAQPPTEEAIRNTITSFLETSRKQDRIILLIVGHVIEANGEPALLPIDGLTDGKDAVIPLKWIYEQMAKCRARQKVLILDACRLDPAKGQERPGGGPMNAKLDAMLKEPPPGVQVWSSCIAEQSSYEFSDGGLFLDKLYEEVEKVSEGKILKPSDPLPLDRLMNAVNAGMQKTLATFGKKQTSRLSGSEPDDGADPDPNEKAPPKPKIAAAGKAVKSADLTLVRSILSEISFPPLKVGQDNKALTAEALPPFPADALEDYAKDGEPTALRAEVLKARDVFLDIAKSELKDSYDVEPDAQLKAKVRTKQMEVAKLILKLQEASDALKEKEIVQLRKKETKRWQANYDYVSARLEAQIAYLNEYEAVLGQIQKGLTPPDPNKYRGWRLASQFDAQTGDSASKKLGNESRKKMDKIIDAYPNTPWSLLARRDRTSGLGLEWQPLPK